MKTTFEKMEAIQLKIASLKEEQSKIEHAVSKELLNILKKHETFSLDFDTLVGGLLHVIQSTKANTSETEGWRQSGQRFRQGNRSKRAIKTKEAMD